MAHVFGRQSFGNVEERPILLELYGLLVALELALKDDRPAWTAGHDVPSLAKENSVDAAVDAAATGLNNALRALSCTLPDGSVGSVRPRAYPDVRYLVHTTEDPTGSTEVDIQAALDSARVLREELDRSWKLSGKGKVIP